MPKLLIALDIGNVCLSLHPDRVIKAFGFSIFPSEAEKAANDYSTGKLNTAQWLDKARLFSKGKMTDQEIIDGWNSILGPAIPGMSEAVSAAINQGVRFVFFSDTCESHMTWIRRNLSFCHLVTGEILSYEVGACKPDPAMYAAFEKKYGHPDLYFDDLSKNIEGGLAAGWDAVQYKGPEQFSEAIRRKLAGLNS